VHVLCELYGSVRRQLNPSARSAPATLQVELVPVASGFASPLDIQQAGDGSGRLFVVEQAGRIKIIQSGNVLGTPYLDISTFVASGGEMGLLGLAFIRTSHRTMLLCELHVHTKRQGADIYLGISRNHRNG